MIESLQVYHGEAVNFRPGRLMTAAFRPSRLITALEL